MVAGPPRWRVCGAGVLPANLLDKINGQKWKSPLFDIEALGLREIEGFLSTLQDRGSFFHPRSWSAEASELARQSSKIVFGEGPFDLHPSVPKTVLMRSPRMPQDRGVGAPQGLGFEGVAMSGACFNGAVFGLETE